MLASAGRTNVVPRGTPLHAHGDTPVLLFHTTAEQTFDEAGFLHFGSVMAPPTIIPGPTNAPTRAEYARDLQPLRPQNVQRTKELRYIIFVFLRALLHTAECCRRKHCLCSFLQRGGTALTWSILCSTDAIYRCPVQLRCLKNVTTRFLFSLHRYPLQRDATGVTP